jgi:tetratricopeptide (TPR) repeat protein
MTRIFTLMLLFAFLIAPTLGAAGQMDDRLNELFARLHVTEDPTEAQELENITWAIWKRSEMASINILIQQGEEAMNAGDFATALQTFNAKVKLEPDFAEGWNKRATIHYLIDNYAASVADVERTLALEPCHFGALSGLGLVYDTTNVKKKAFEACRSALEIYPNLFGVRLRIEQLSKDI